MTNNPQAPEISEALITALVLDFYDRVRADAELGPIFDRAIGDDWDAHLAKMCDFWSSVMLTSGRYKGNPMLTHMRLKTVRPDHFARWLALFAETADELTPPAIAAQFRARSELIARSLQMGMFFRPDAPKEKMP